MPLRGVNEINGFDGRLEHSCSMRHVMLSVLIPSENKPVRWHL